MKKTVARRPEIPVHLRFINLHPSRKVVLCSVAGTLKSSGRSRVPDLGNSPEIQTDKLLPASS